MRRSGPPRLGVVIPTLDEARHLPLLLRDLRNLSMPHRIVVADGGSSDGTRELARERGAEVLHAPRGRALQMNAGAAALDTPWLLFLHADSRLPGEAREALARWLATAPERASAYFRFRLEGAHWFWRLLEIGQALRERVMRIPYGDQGLLVSSETFESAGGFPELPLLEDVEFFSRLRSHGTVERLPAPLVTSPRRYEREGRWTALLRNAAIIGLHAAGVSPRRIADWYDRERSSSTRPDRTHAGTLIVFAKAPVEGRVKTRLAESVGVEEATRIYRALGRRVVEQVRGGRYRIVVYYDPPDASGERQVREWLGEAGLRFRPQGPGDLGERMAHAFEECLHEARRVCIVGTDAPGVDRDRVEEAFAALDRTEVVFGPTYDGGYYLLGLSRPFPELFEEVPWSTPEVLAKSLRRARSRGVRPHLLEPLHDVDTIEDLEHVGERLEDAMERSGGAPPRHER